MELFNYEIIDVINQIICQYEILHDKVNVL